jgi:flagellar FliJ protein
MKGFHFTLEAVRTLRRRQEQQALEQYSQALLVRQRAMARLETAQRELESALHESRIIMAKGCSAHEAARSSEYQQSLGKVRDERFAALGTAERGVNNAMRAMLLARQQREVVDKCFDRQKSRFQREEMRVEQKIMDEFAGRRGIHGFAFNPTGATT